MNEQEDLGLWESFWRGCEVARERLIVAYTPFVRMVAAKLYSSRSDPGFEFDDYFQFGLVGLIESLDRYQDGGDAKFKTFAHYRIRGAILDGVAGLSDRQRQITHYSKLRKDRLESLSSKTSTDEESLDEALKRMGELVVDVAIGVLIDGSAFCSDDTIAIEDTRYRDFELRHTKDRVVRLINQLPDDQAKVLRMHYFQEWPFDEIALHMGLSKGRVSQLHKQAIFEVRKIL